MGIFIHTVPDSKGSSSAPSGPVTITSQPGQGRPTVPGRSIHSPADT